MSRRNAFGLTTDAQQPTILRNHEWSAWMRGRVGEAARRAQRLVPAGTPVVTPLGRTTTHGSREDRTCDRCRVYVVPGSNAEFVLIATYPAPHVMVTAGLCGPCYSLEVPGDSR